MCLNGSGGFLLLCKISPAHGCFKGVRKDIDDLYFGIFVGQWVIFQGVWRSEEAKGLRCKEPEGKEIFGCKVVIGGIRGVYITGK